MQERSVDNGSITDRKIISRRQFTSALALSLLGPTLLAACGSPSTEIPKPTVKPTPGLLPTPDSPATVVAQQTEISKLQDQVNSPKGQLKQSEQGGPAPTDTAVSEVPTVGPTQVPLPAPTAVQACSELVIPAQKDPDGRWELANPDDMTKTKPLALPDGFTPDVSLCYATDIKPRPISSDLSSYADWEKALNTKRPDGVPLAGYNYDYNDWCSVPGFLCNVQADLFGWSTFQGETLKVPKIGELDGSVRRSVVLNVLNLDNTVEAWDLDGDCPVYAKRGFRATGRIFNGQKNVDLLEENLTGHWLSTQFYGEPSKSYIGITGNPDNALSTLVVSVQRKQWGNNPDGSRRIEFQLIRAEIFNRPSPK